MFSFVFDIPSLISLCIKLDFCPLSSTDILPVVTEILKLGMSINLYMFHGGTNFGFMSGAFAVGLPAPKPMVTSYGV